MNKISKRRLSQIFLLLLGVLFTVVAVVKPLDYVQANAVTSVATFVSLLVLANVIWHTRNTAQPVVWAFLVGLFFDFGTSEVGSLARVYYYATDHVPTYMLQFQPRLSMVKIVSIVELTILVVLIRTSNTERSILRFLTYGMVGLICLYTVLHFLLPHIL